MSFAANHSQQISLFDATANLTDREKGCWKNPGRNILLRTSFRK